MIYKMCPLEKRNQTLHMHAQCKVILDWTFAFWDAENPCWHFTCTFMYEWQEVHCKSHSYSALISIDKNTHDTDILKDSDIVLCLK